MTLGILPYLSTWPVFREIPGEYSSPVLFAESVENAHFQIAYLLHLQVLSAGQILALPARQASQLHCSHAAAAQM